MTRFQSSVLLSAGLLLSACPAEPSAPTEQTTRESSPPVARPAASSSPPAPAPTPTAAAPTPSKLAAEAPTDAPPVDATIAAPATTEVTATPAPSAPVDVYSGTHKLGVNRVTDMARVGSATFSRRDGALYLEGRVKRGVHWLHLSGKVEPRGNDKFVLTGVLEGIPDMRWNGEAPRERRTEGSFLFEVNKRRPYWRLYQVNGRDCVCWDNCGNDFCYIDIETKPQP